MVFYVIPIMIILMLMAYQDFKSRSITVLLFVALAGLLLATALRHHSWMDIIEAISINLIFIFLHIIAVLLYLFLKHKTFVNPFRDYLGIGDLLFWVAVSPAFSPFNYILTFLISVLFALCVSVLLRYRHRQTTIPLAGLQAVFYACFFAVNFLVLHLDCHDDSLLLFSLV